MASTLDIRDAKLEIDGRVALLTLDRHDVRNTLTGTGLAEAIETTCAWVNGNRDISVLVITGAGSAFSAGGNLVAMREEVAEAGEDFERLAMLMRSDIQRIPRALHDVEVPVIAAVNGPAIGAGCDLACMCDVRIASTAAVFGETFLNVGLISGDGGAWFLGKLLGYQRAADLTFSGRTFGADEALAMGLLLEVTEPGALLDRALAIARDYASKPPTAVRYTKRLLKLAERVQLKDFLEQCAYYQALCFRSEDHDRAVTAFVEKRRVASQAANIPPE
jgi:enoyl-CoA hydratase/carnithine racemase